MKQRGFTFLELLLAVSILAIIAGASMLYLGGVPNTRRLDAAERDVISLLREAQSNAMSRVMSENWGVRIWNGGAAGSPCPTGSCAELFRGTTTSSTVVRTMYFPNAVTFTSPTSGSKLDVLFEELTGKVLTSSSPVIRYFGGGADSCEYSAGACSLRLAEYVGAGGNCDDAGGSDAWSCSTINAPPSDKVRYASSAAFDGSGRLWVAYERNVPGVESYLELARYRPGVAASGGCAVDWDCVAVYNPSMDSSVGIWAALAFDTDGEAWVAFKNSSQQRVMLAREESGNPASGGCAANWRCVTIDDSLFFPDNDNIDLAFDFLGQPIITYGYANNRDLRVARYVGESGSDPGCTANSDPLAWRCTTVDDPTDVNTYAGGGMAIALDAGGTIWLRYTETVFDMSGNPVSTKLKAARYVPQGGGNCDDVPGHTGSDQWSCSYITSISHNDTTYGTAIAVDQTGKPTIAYYFCNTSIVSCPNHSLRLAEYVGSAGTGCSDTAEWTCKVIDQPGGGNSVNYVALAFDGPGNLAISYYQLLGGSNGDLRVARYLAASGSDVGCSGNTDPASWECVTVANPATEDVGYYTQIFPNAPTKIVIVLQSQPGRARGIAVLSQGGIVSQ